MTSALVDDDGLTTMVVVTSGRTLAEVV